MIPAEFPPDWTPRERHEAGWFVWRATSVTRVRFSKTDPTAWHPREHAIAPGRGIYGWSALGNGMGWDGDGDGAVRCGCSFRRQRDVIKSGVRRLYGMEWGNGIRARKGKDGMYSTVQ